MYVNDKAPAIDTQYKSSRDDEHINNWNLFPPQRINNVQYQIGEYYQEKVARTQARSRQSNGC